MSEMSVPQKNKQTGYSDFNLASAKKNDLKIITFVMVEVLFCSVPLALTHKRVTSGGVWTGFINSHCLFLKN